MFFYFPLKFCQGMKLFYCLKLQIGYIESHAAVCIYFKDELIAINGSRDREIVQCT